MGVILNNLIPIIGSSIAMSIPLVLASVGGAACMEAGTVANATEQSIYATQSGRCAAASWPWAWRA